MTPETIPQRLFQRAQSSPDEPALHEWHESGWKTITWRGYADQVRACGKALLKLGMEEGQTVAILGDNRPEWVITDIAAMCLGGVATGLYITSSADEIRYIVEHAESLMLLVETEDQLKRTLEVKDQLPALKLIVAMKNGPSAEGVMSWEEFLKTGEDVADEDFDKRMRGLRDDQLATLIYTSGTTGRPKGVMLSHRNLAWTASIAQQVVAIGPGDRGISYLPLSHIAEQMFTIHVPVSCGAQVFFAKSREMLKDHLLDIQPTFFFGVPRVWEKFHTLISTKMKDATGLKAKILAWSRSVATQVHNLSFQGLEPGLLLSWKYALAKKLVFSKLKAKVGFGDARFLVSGAAPLRKDILEFFASLDLPILEVYGQSEDCGPTTFNRPGRTKLGTVGPAIPGVEVKIADDEEIVVKGPNVFLGYYKNPEATAETLIDGWLHSGDLGALDQQGFLSIIGRKKDLIITAGGKNIAPKKIEEAILTHPLVGQAVLIGDQRPYLTALLTLDEDAAQALGRSVEELSKDADIRADIQRKVDEVNSQSSKVKGVKYFEILPKSFSVEGGELTPTLKIKRSVVAKLHASVIETMYNKERPST